MDRLSAQIKVTTNGHVGIGVGAITFPNPGFKLHIMDYLCLGPYNNQSFSKGLLFSRINNPTEYGVTGVDWGIDSDYGGINFWKPASSTNPGNYKFLIKDDGTVAVGQSTVDVGIKMQVNGKVKGVQFVNSSDERIKDNIQNIAMGLEAIMQLKPVSYTLKAPILSENESGKAEFKDFADYPDPSFDTKQVQYGFLAQDLKKVLPDLVIGQESEEQYLGIDYIGMIPVLVQSIQELKYQLDACQCNGSKSSERISTEPLNIVEGSLAQNIPNPFKEDTKIGFTLPSTFNDAVINIYALDGKQLKSYPIHDKLANQITVKGNELYPGIFIYALIVDGREVATKKMILTE